MCGQKKYNFWQNNFKILENSCRDSKKFWDKWKECTNNSNQKVKTEITGDSWYNHFSKLHFCNTEMENIVCRATSPPNVDLNRPFSMGELTESIDKMKTNKGIRYDRISSEMLKNSPVGVKTVILDFFNLCLEKSLMPESLCKEIITPIHKNGCTTTPIIIGEYPFHRFLPNFLHV